MKYICSIQVISMSIYIYQCRYYLESQEFLQELLTAKDHSAKVHIGLILKFHFFFSLHGRGSGPNILTTKLEIPNHIPQTQ
jgi:hypothetical protein